jgi:hypothetical protein
MLVVLNNAFAICTTPVGLAMNRQSKTITKGEIAEPIDVTTVGMALPTRLICQWLMHHLFG